jgi:hypothetical protein
MPNTPYGYPYPLSSDFVADGATAIQALAQAVNDLQAGPRRTIVATSARNSPLNAAWGDVSGFTFPTVAGANYAIECALFLSSASATPKARLGWSWTGTGSMTHAEAGLDTNVAATAYNGSWTAHGAQNIATSPSQPTTGVGVPAVGGMVTLARAAATFICTVSGSVQLRFAQFTSDATNVCVINIGSRMTYERC